MFVLNRYVKSNNIHYYGNHTGDLYIQAKYGSSESGTISIEDCTYYNPNSITTITTTNILLSSNFEITFKVKRTSSNANTAYLEIGGNTGNTALMGQVGRNGENQIRIYTSEGSSTNDTYATSNTPLNEEVLEKWIHIGSDNTFSMNDSVNTFTNNKPHAKIKRIVVNSNYIKELKVKPL